MNTLHLTSPEKQLFDSLPEDLREGWQIQTEDLVYQDSPAKRELRLSLVRLHDPLLLRVREATQHSNNVEEVAKMMMDMNLHNVDEDDLASLFFALGPDDISRLISHLLNRAATDVDLEGITALTVIRHEILKSFHSVSR